MSLEESTPLGSYEILAPIGAGGMGEVYRALDTKLGREVAIKVLPEAFIKDRERLARFEREARLLASLNHPNIATIHGLEESGGIRFLVMELVPGETLAERISRSPVLIGEALPIFQQIAEALEAAHEKGIVHRDLKPANVKVTPEGKVKVLDFGLAKALEEETPVSDMSQSPTLTRLRQGSGEASPTGAGVIMGTAAYMSPEQARGKSVDKRADIWAFGCCLYEALTGRKAFGGETVTDTLAAIINKEPDWEALPKATPLKIRELLRWCLTKDPRRRLRDIGDAWTEIDMVSAEPPVEPVPSGRISRLFLIALVTAILGAAGVWSMTRSSPPAPRPVSRFAVHIPPDQQPDLSLRSGLTNSPLALSPDGSLLAYVAENDGKRQLFLRALDEFDAKPIPGTEGATQPFFSPDGDWVGFVAEDKLKKLSVRGAEPLTIINTTHPVGASWGVDGSIVYSDDASLLRIPAGGGQPETLLTLDRAQGEWAVDPQILPDGNQVVFCALNFGKERRIESLSLETGERRVLLRGSDNLRQARYLPSGHIIYSEGGRLMAAAVDQSRIEVTGVPISVIENVYTLDPWSTAYFTISDKGTIVYVPGFEMSSRLVWIDRDGNETPLTEEGLWAFPRISPGGGQVAAYGDSATWIIDVERKTRRPLHGGIMPVWSPDGKEVAYQDVTSGDLYRIQADGSGEKELLLTSDIAMFAMSWSADGRYLAFNERSVNTRNDIWVLPLQGDRSPVPVLATEFDEKTPMFSPDGQWLAYVSDESGREEVYVQPYPGPGAKHLISSEGGWDPVWSPEGREIFYYNGHHLLAVTIEVQPTFSAGTPQALFEIRRQFNVSFPGYDVAPDGRRFLVTKEAEESEPIRFHVVLNWTEELKRLVPTK